MTGSASGRTGACAPRVPATSRIEVHAARARVMVIGTLPPHQCLASPTLHAREVPERGLHDRPVSGAAGCTGRDARPKLSPAWVGSQAPRRRPNLMKPKYFSTSAKWRSWLQRHHATKDELLVGFYKKHSGKP